MLAVTAFSVGIYAWAQRTALPAERIERLIRAGAASPVPPAAPHRAWPRLGRRRLGPPAVGR